jgi:tetratricopeptide (TPR) repeat protein
MRRRRLVSIGLLGATVGIALLLAPARKIDSPIPEPAAVPPTGPAPMQEKPPAIQPTEPAKPAEPSAADGAALRDEADRLIAEGKVMEGLEVFRRAVEAEPTARNHGELGALLYRLTAFDEAARHLRAAAELDPMNADRWIALANVYYRNVDLGEAWKAEKRAREAEPGLELGRDASGMRIRKGDKARGEP